MIAAGQVRMELKEDVPRLWLRVTVTGAARGSGGHPAGSARQRGLSGIGRNSCAIRAAARRGGGGADYGALNRSPSWSFAERADRGWRAEEAVRLNTALSADGFTREYGMQAGKTLDRVAGCWAATADGGGLRGARAWTRGWRFRRLAAMSNSGSGNQGLTCTARSRRRASGWAGAMKRSCRGGVERIC